MIPFSVVVDTGKHCAVYRELSSRARPEPLASGGDITWARSSKPHGMLTST